MKFYFFLEFRPPTKTEKRHPDVELKAYHHFELDETMQVYSTTQTVHSTFEAKPAKGVLIHSPKKTRTKKSVHWRADEELNTYRYFELDEMERKVESCEDYFSDW